MNKKTFSLFVRRRSVRAIVLLAIAVTATLASCSNDEMTDNQVEALPEGMYPLTFTATQGEVMTLPQSRVSDYDDADGKHKSMWMNGDQIQVKVSDNNGNNMETTCTLDVNGNITKYDPQLYWQTTGNYTINAWYSNITGRNTTSGTVSLDNQSSGLAYVLKADELTDKNYQSGNLPLNFKHQLAKVRVKLTGDKAGEVTAVEVKGYTTCTVTNGEISNGGSEKSISMYHPENSDYYEANLVPQTITSNDFIRLQNGNVQATVTGITKLEAGNVYTITIDVKDSGVIDPDDVGIISDNGEYIIKGSGTKTITISDGSPTITLKGVSIAINGQDQPAINITGGSPTLIVEGTDNTLSSAQWGGITMSGGANLTIKGNGKDLSSLKVIANSNGYETVSTVGIGASSNAACGYIKIQDVTLIVSGGDSWNGATGSAAIGTSTVNSKCGPIGITQSVITATGGKAAAAIGLGYTAGASEKNNVWHNKVESITIKESAVIATVKSSNWSECGACIGLCAAVGTAKLECGTITIENVADDFLNKLTRTGNFENVQSWRIGKGMIMGTNTGTVLFSGGTFNGTTFTGGYGNW